MVADGEEMNDYENDGKDQKLNDEKNNFSRQKFSGPGSSNARVDTQSKELYFTLNIYKEYNLKIYKPLIPIKLCLFFWFAGAHGIQVFLPVFLKTRGFSVNQMSLTISAGAVFQILASSLSAAIADKIGRTKPILYAHLILTALAGFLFVLVPQLKTDADMLQFQLLGIINESTHNRITVSLCNISISDALSTCKLYYATNSSHISYKNDCFKVSNFEESFTIKDNYTNILENVTVCLYDAAQAVGSGSLPTICNGVYCKVLIQECTFGKNGKCSGYWDSRTTLVFTAYVLLITIYLATSSCVFNFYDVIGMSLTVEHNGDFGKQRIWSVIGSLVGPSLAGYVMQLTSGDDRNYSLAFAFFCVFTILTALTSWKLKVPARKPGKRMWRKVMVLLKNPDILAFTIVLFVLGTSFNIITLYSNWFREDLGASKLLLGLVMPLSSVFSVVLLFASEWYLQKLGKHNIFILAMIGYVCYFVSFSFIVEPWYSILSGVVAYSFSSNLLWVAVIEFSHVFAPEGLYASVIVYSGTIHFLISRVIASLIGGMLINAYGGRIAFRVIGGTNLVAALCYGCFRYCRRSLRK